MAKIGTEFLRIKATPSSSQNRLFNSVGGLKAWLSAPPVEREGNKALKVLVAKAARVPISRVSVVKGLSSRQKTLEISAISEEELTERIGTLPKSD